MPRAAKPGHREDDADPGLAERSIAVNPIKQSLIQRVSHLHHAVWWTRAMTLGVRAVVLDVRGVFLVRHTYLPGWYLPGGAVDRGESAEAAVVRELREEGGIACTQRPMLHGFYRNARHSRRDHVACFVIRRFDVGATGPSSDWEIAETGFFAVDALPGGTTPSTRTRLDEILNGRPISEDW